MEKALGKKKKWSPYIYLLKESVTDRQAGHLILYPYNSITPRRGGL